MERGWDASGRLEAFWDRVGGRDRLAKRTGIQPGTLSGYNTGRLPLGLANARKIAEALEISLLELGAPEAQPDQRGRSLIDHQEELEAEVIRLATDVRRLTRRVQALERQARPSTGRVGKERS
jgi:transcriptional regulator with XRE-family HTH domain